MNITRTLWVAAGSMILAAGCTVGPDYERPEVAAPEAWSAAGEKVGSGTVDLSEWWTVFRDPVLDSLVGRALEANLDLQTAGARVREARAQAGVARGALLPEAAVGHSYTRQRLSENGVFPAGKDPVYDVYSSGFDAAWEIDVFGGIRRSVEASGADLEASVEDRRAVLVSLLGEVARNYIELRGAQRQAAVLRQNVGAARGTLDLTRTRLRAGLATELDVARAESLVASTESAVPQAVRASRVAIHRLAVLLGQTPDRLSAELETERPIPAPPDRILVGLPSDLLARRPDVRRAERQLAAATARIGVATAELYPKFSLTGSFGLEAVDASDLRKAASRAWSIGPSVRWSIFAGGRIAANIDVHDARAEQALLAYRQSWLVALEDVENALVSYLREWDRRRSVGEAVTASRKSVQLAGDLYRNGLANFLEVHDAERALYDLERQLAESEAAIGVSAVSLYKALGGGWK